MLQPGARGQLDIVVPSPHLYVVSSTINNYVVNSLYQLCHHLCKWPGRTHWHCIVLSAATEHSEGTNDIIIAVNVYAILHQ